MLNKAELKVLERIFAAEIEDRLPAQFKSKHLPQLQARGYVEQVMVKMGRPPCSVTGWVLTLRGNYAYCQSCKDVELPEVSTKNVHK